MLAKNWMTKTVVSINACDSIKNAVDLMKKNEISMLPVLENNVLAGIVTEADLKFVSVLNNLGGTYSENQNNVFCIKIREVMSQNFVTIPDDYTIAEAAEQLLVYKIIGAPVVNKKKELIGLITHTDILRALIMFTGAGKSRVQFAVEVANQQGCIKKITDLVRSLGGRINNVVTSLSRAPDGCIRVYIQAYNFDLPRLEQLKESLDTQGKLLYIIDHNAKVREIYWQDEDVIH